MKTRKLFLSLVIMVLILVNAVSVSAEPSLSPFDPNLDWVNAALLKKTVNDCYGPDAQVEEDQDLGIDELPEVWPCQSYQGDLYESLKYSENPPEATGADIKVFQLGWDDDFIYVQFDMDGDWTPDFTGHQYITELDIDLDMQGDFYISIQGSDVFNSASWVDTYDEGDSGVFEDVNNDIGGSDLMLPEPGSDPNSLYDAYEFEYVDTDNQVYARIIDGNVQVAVRRSFIGAEDFVDLRARGTTSQSSTIEPNKMYWHDENPIADLSDEDFDNTLWTEGTSSVAVQSVVGNSFISYAGVALVGLVMGMGVLTLPVIKKRK